MYRHTLAFVPSHDNPEVGNMCVRYEDQSHDEPKRMILYWPVCFGLRKHLIEDWPEMDDPTIELREGRPGEYYFSRGAFGFSPTIRLKNGGQTTPVKTEIMPIFCPKVRKGIETRYHRGTWEKYLKTEGWVPA